MSSGHHLALSLGAWRSSSGSAPTVQQAGMPERPKGADCKICRQFAFGGLKSFSRHNNPPKY